MTPISLVSVSELIIYNSFVFNSFYKSHIPHLLSRQLHIMFLSLSFHSYAREAYCLGLCCFLFPQNCCLTFLVPGGLPSCTKDKWKLTHIGTFCRFLWGTWVSVYHQEISSRYSTVSVLFKPQSGLITRIAAGACWAGTTCAAAKSWFGDCWPTHPNIVMI